jgi:dsRNA-specific ribonuclease
MEDLSPQHSHRLSELERLLGYAFREPALLRQAITHKSFSNENAQLGLPHNESLEFLGDSVLNFVISTRLYSMFAGSSEGELSRFRSYLVSGRHLVSLARELHLVVLLQDVARPDHGGKKQNIHIDTLGGHTPSSWTAASGRRGIRAGFSEVLGQLARRVRLGLQESDTS